MNRSLVAFSLAVILTAANFAKADAAPAITFPQGKDAVTIPLARARENLCVKATIDGQAAGYYILDSGASHGIVDPAFAKKAKLPVLGAASILGATGSIQSNYRQARSMEIGGIALAAPVLFEQDLAKTVYGLDNIPMKGLVGYDFLGAMPFTIDFQAATLTLYRPGIFTAPKGAKVFPIDTIMGCPAVQVGIDDQAQGWFLLDTGAAGVDLTALGTRLVPEVERQAGTALVLSSGIGGTQMLLRSPVDFEYLGHREKFLARFPLHKPIGGNESKQTGRLGYDCFADARLTVDGPNAKVYVEWCEPLTTEAWVKAAGDSHKADLLGSTVLTRAAKENRLDVAKALVAAGADVAATDRYGGTALFAAAQNGNLELVQLLLDHGAPVDVVTKLNAAAQVETPLQIAAERGHAKVVAALLKAGAATAGKDPFGRFPLQQAAVAGQTDCVKLLLEAGASTSQKIPDLNLTALHSAAIFGHADVIEALLGAHADAKAADSDGNTPLHLAAFNKRDAAAQALLQAKPKIDARNNNDQTPLMAAAVNGDVAICRMLLAAGADPAAKDGGGRSVLDYAGNFGDAQTIKLIAEALNSAAKPASQP